MTIKITPNDKGNPPGKLAEAELHFSDGPLEGLKLIGFSVWERRGGPPQLQLHGGAGRRFAAIGGRSSLVTITHSDALAFAQVLILG